MLTQSATARRLNTQSLANDHLASMALLALDQTTDPVYYLHENGNFAYVNRAVCHKLGYDKNELLQLNIGDIDAEIIPNWQSYWQKVKQQGSLALSSFYKTKEGKYLPVEINVTYLSWEGVEYQCVFARDLSERLEAESGLIEAKEQLRAVLDAVPGLVSWVSSDLSYLGINQHLADAYNLPPSYFVGKKVGFLETSPKFTNLVYDFFSIPEQTISQEVTSNVNGEARTYLIVAQKYHQGEAAVFVGLDISYRKEMEMALMLSEEKSRLQTRELEALLQKLQSTQTQLIQTEKMYSLGQLVAGIAHEINNPVNFISGNVSHAINYANDLINLILLYQDHYPKPVVEIEQELGIIGWDFLQEDLPKLLDSMKLGAKRISEVVHSLRQFSRLDESEMKLVDIHKGMDSTLLILQNRCLGKAGRTSINVVKDYGILPKIECYASQLNQVFMNIITNSLDALELLLLESQEGSFGYQPTLKISTSVGKITGNDHNYALIRIWDNGPGIDQDILPYIFDSLFTTKPTGKGTGLGLSIARHLVEEKHGGVLLCNSEPGKFTEFLIAIPLFPNFTRV